MFQKPTRWRRFLDFPADQSHFSFPVSGGGFGPILAFAAFQLTELLHNICPLWSLVVRPHQFNAPGIWLPRPALDWPARGSVISIFTNKLQMGTFGNDFPRMEDL